VGERAVQAARDAGACNLCGSVERRPYRPGTGLGLVRCERCRLVYVHPRPGLAEIAAVYDERYFRSEDSGTVGYADYLGDEANIRRTFARRLERLERWVRPGRVLDVGCAAGFFLDEARRRGWTPQGLDVSAFAVQYARTRFGCDVRHAGLLEASLPAAAYDLVTMWDVIEHVPDPAACVRRAAELLRPGGLLALATPDLGSLPARLTGARWIGYKLSREHLYYFERRTLRRLLGTAGLEVVDTRHVGKYVSVRLFLDRLGRYTPWLAGPLDRAARALGLSARAVYANPLDIVWVTARKPR
jgi:2-polyprenyl-3-methyl-5-hydroxy-6-metoxy-1,4-benzoquinol methylase